MYKLQFLNVYTQGVVRELTYNTESQIKKLLSEFEKTKGMTCYLFDEADRTLSAVFVSSLISKEDNTKVYKLFFKVKLSAKQIPASNFSSK